MIVVTGAAGFIGTQVVTRLVEAGHHVVGIDRRPAAAWSTPTSMILTELSRPSVAARRALYDADGIVHLAGRPGVRDASPDADELRQRDNVLATAAVLAGARADVAVVMTSSSSVYGGAPDGRPCHEDQPLRPLGGYARSKAAAEAIAAKRRGPTCVLRPFTVVGEHQREDMALTRWLRAAFAGRPIEVFGGLDRTRDLTDVADVARAVHAALDRRVHGVVNVGTGRARPLADCVAAIRRLVPGASVVTTDLPVHEPDDTLADTARCERLLGLRPSTDLDAVVVRQARSLGLLAPSRAADPLALVAGA